MNLSQRLRGATDTFLELALIYTAVVCVAAALFAAIEGRTFGDALWWAVVTATTTGYGDISPTSAAGRVLAGALMHASSWLIFPLITARMASTLIVNNDAFTHQEQEAIQTSLRAIMDRLEQDAA